MNSYQMYTKYIKGITLIELIIVLAVIAIVGAILIPKFTSSTDKAKLKSDIQSAKIIHNAMDLYNVENTSPLAGAMDANIGKLIDENYIKASEVKTQTENAKWEMDNTKKIVVVDIAGCSDGAKNAFNELTEHEKYYVKK